MSFVRNRIRRDESGASLILAIAFMLVAGTIGASLLASVSSSSYNRVGLDKVRNRQYDADAAIERAIAHIRSVNPITGSYDDACSAPTDPQWNTWNGQNSGLSFYVSCAYSPSVAPLPGPGGNPVSPNNVTFFACQGTVACTPTTATITARVNFQVVSSRVVTFVQSWSVNK